MSIVSNNIKYLRRLHGLTQEQFARRIGIKRSLVGAYEEARANPNLDNLTVMARTFNVSIDHLIKQDLRKVRDTPNLTFESNQAENATAVPPPSPTPPTASEPKPLANVFQQYYTPPEAPKPPTPAEEYRSVPKAEQLWSFNNVYEKDGEQSNTPQTEPPIPKKIQYVRQNQLTEYAEKHRNGDFLNNLPLLQFPVLPDGHYRAFEAGEDFAFPGAYLIGSFVRNWFDIVDGRNYVVFAKSMGGVYRRVYNQVKIKSTLLLSADKAGIPSFEIPIKEVLEVWEIKAFLSTTLPDPSVSFTHLQHLVSQMQDELDRIKK